MANQMDNITKAMNVVLEDEEEGGLALEGFEGTNNEDKKVVGEAKLCLVGRFLTEGIFDFQAMQQTLAALWKSGKRVYIKALEGNNMFLFQFFHEIDIKRVIDGSPWSFNRRVLLIARLQESMNPRCIPLNSIDLWVQIHDMQPGFMSEKVFMEIGNQIGTFVSSCPNNYKGIWRDYMRIRVTIDVAKPLKRRINVRKSGNEWSWITFKCENVQTFCFICGILGHSDKFCSRLFEIPENKVTRPYGAWMRAPLHRSNMMIRSKWLRNGINDEMFSEMKAGGASGSNIGVTVGLDNRFPQSTGGVDPGKKLGDAAQHDQIRGEKSGILNQVTKGEGGKLKTCVKSVILENKKKGQTRGMNWALIQNWSRSLTVRI